MRIPARSSLIPIETEAKTRTTAAFPPRVPARVNAYASVLWNRSVASQITQKPMQARIAAFGHRS